MLHSEHRQDLLLRFLQKTGGSLDAPLGRGYFEAATDPKAERIADETIAGPPPMSGVSFARPDDHPGTSRIGGKDFFTERSHLTTPTSSPTSTRRELAPGSFDLAEWDKRDDVAGAVWLFIGIDGEAGVTSQWKVGTATLTVTPWLDHAGYWKLSIVSGWPRRSGKPRKALALVEVFAAHSARRLSDRLGRSFQGLWSVRKLAELGFIPPPDPFPLPLLPADPPKAVRDFWKGLSGLLAYRALTGRDDKKDGFPVAETEHLALWLGMPLAEVRSAKRWLEARGFLRRGGLETIGSGRRMQLWHIGSGDAAA
jgi:hypothetical protein